ncbi:MAG: phosphotransferase enzyme family protein [Phycisphaeraceae bacterium]
MNDQPRKVPKAEATTVQDTAASPGEAGLSSAGGASAVTGVSSADAMRGRSSGSQTGQRSQFEAFELAIVLSHFDLGIIQAIQAYPRGSRKAPKVILRADSGRYLLKRRAPGRHDAYKVAFCHALQLHLAQRQFPLPRLIGTKKHNNSMLQWNDNIYELFEYIKGSSYDRSPEATYEAGKTLALFHKLVLDHQPEYDPSHGSYHAASSVHQALEQLPATLHRTHPDANEHPRLTDLTRRLHETYDRAAQRVEDLGLDRWPMQIVHSDWHPGNMLFRGARVVAVIDYDSARIYQRIIDVANGALQFSMIAKGEDPRQWPDHVDESRFKRFVRGYDSLRDAVLSRAELRAMPWLMIEALIAESAIPIAATGSFSTLSGADFLHMVQRKVHWIETHADQLVALIDA